MSMSRFTRLTSAMIYGGTFLLSILSFFTTYMGMTILLDKKLALIGSLGLQVALLGIAWNLMKLKNNRAYYVVVFLSAAAFSMFFSYANFDTALQASTRKTDARLGYAEAGRPILARYRTVAQEAVQKGRYQVERLNKLKELEENQGWATYIDEGSKDPFIQSVIDGARMSVNSWETTQREDYHQGMGKGLIVNYFESQVVRTKNNIDIIKNYMKQVDTLSLALNSHLPVDKQHELVNHAWVNFPIGEVTLHLSREITLPHPPQMGEFIETPVSNQQAFLMVINDLLEMDRLALFSLLLAIVIDLIIILMALCGSQVMSNEELVFEKVKNEATSQIKKMKMTNDEEFAQKLQSNINRYEKACQYNLAMMSTVQSYKNAKNRFFVRIPHGPEGLPEIENKLSDLEIPVTKISGRTGIKNNIVEEPEIEQETVLK